VAAEGFVHTEVAEIPNVLWQAVDKARSDGAAGEAHDVAVRMFAPDYDLTRAAHRAAAEKIVRLALVAHHNATRHGIRPEHAPDSSVVAGPCKVKAYVHHDL
jgi:hypothetical protein